MNSGFYIFRSFHFLFLILFLLSILFASRSFLHPSFPNLVRVSYSFPVIQFFFVSHSLQLPNLTSCPSLFSLFVILFIPTNFQPIVSVFFVFFFPPNLPISSTPHLYSFLVSVSARLGLSRLSYPLLYRHFYLAVQKFFCLLI